MLDADVDGDVDVVHVVSGDVDVDVDSDVGGDVDVVDHVSGDVVSAELDVNAGGVDVDVDVGDDVKIVRTPSVKWRLHNYAHRSRSMETVLCTERYHGNSEEGYDEDDDGHCVR